jgi:hypothetical protein
MESGADDLPLTVIPSNHTPSWDPERDGYVVFVKSLIMVIEAHLTA